MQTGRKILNLRCDRKVSQQDLARACAITPSALSKIEAGINSPRANVIWRIAKNLGVTVEYLLDEAMPYPYTGYSYRQGCLASNVDPTSSVRLDVTREEKAFLETLRSVSQVAREIAYSVPEQSVEVLRLIHFLIHHGRIQNPSTSFMKSFESLVGQRHPSGDASEEEVPAATARRTQRPPARRPSAASRRKKKTVGRRG